MYIYRSRNLIPHLKPLQQKMERVPYSRAYAAEDDRMMVYPRFPYFPHSQEVPVLPSFSYYAVDNYQRLLSHYDGLVADMKMELNRLKIEIESLNYQLKLKDQEIREFHNQRLNESLNSNDNK